MLLKVVSLTTLTVFSCFATSPEDLFKSIRNNDLPRLKQLVGDQSTLKQADARGTTALHYAAAFGSVESVKILLDAGAEVNVKNAGDATPLLLAAPAPQKVAALLAKSADPKLATKAGRTPLIVAAASPSATESVRLLLDAGADVNAQDQLGRTPLMEVTAIGDAATARLLIARGAKVNVTDGRGSTPLMEAVVAGDLGLVKLYLEKGADVNAASTYAPAVKHGSIALTKLTPLVLAAPFASAEMVKTLIVAGANVNAQDARGITPLTAAIASENQDPAVVDILIAAGADVNKVDPYGDTPLDWARKYGHPKVLKALETAGAKGKPAPVAPVRPAGKPPLAAADAIGQAVGLLQRSSTEFFKQSGCVGCHNQPLTDIATKAAANAGLKTPSGAIDEHVRTMLSSRPLEPGLLQLIGPGGGVDTVGWLAMGLHSKDTPGNSLTDAIVHYIAGTQGVNGAWSSFGIARPPFEGSGLTRTVLAVHVLSTYGWPARQAEFDDRLARARSWLLRAEPRTTYERAELILGLKWSGAKPADIARFAAALRREQRVDGGWSQTKYLESDAYATGLALYALNQTGQMQPSSESYQRGVAFLLKTQLEDGSWYVRSRSPKFQPYFQGGFPHDHDQWISSTATAYAVMALSPAAQPVTRAQR
ncbi:MAG TPA: ankyrin repeat domain-containing protein [Bryobacteraceae bacterium]|nr:ankyrin repeat domain-containing protein [Bryobacteraceae bacterium]